jgi:hypothetical protein
MKRWLFGFKINDVEKYNANHQSNGRQVKQPDDAAKNTQVVNLKGTNDDVNNDEFPAHFRTIYS